LLVFKCVSNWYMIVDALDYIIPSFYSFILNLGYIVLKNKTNFYMHIMREGEGLFIGHNVQHICGN